jgi:hypothetical protein
MYYISRTDIPGRGYPWTFEGNQTNRCLISFKVSGRSFQLRFFAMSRVWVELTKKQPIEAKAVEFLKEIGRRLARFPLKVDYPRVFEKGD